MVREVEHFTKIYDINLTAADWTKVRATIARQVGEQG